MSRYLLGSVVHLSTTAKVDGVLTDDATMALTITKPDGTTVTPSVSHDGTGLYSYNYTPLAVGHYRYRWTSTGTAAGVDEEEFEVYASARNIIDVDDLKSWLKIADPDDDPQLTVAANAANAAVKTYCGRSFEYVPIGSETTRTFRVRDHRVAEVDDFYDTTNLVVKTDDADAGTFTTTWAATDFELEPLNGLDGPLPVPYWRLRAVANRRFPRWGRRAQLRVTAPWGWVSIPDDVFNAALIKGARLYRRKNTPEGVLGGFGDVGVVRVTSREDPDVAALLRPYRRVGATAMIG